ncbi:radical SAM protein [Marinitoga arctica]
MQKNFDVYYDKEKLKKILLQRIKDEEKNIFPEVVLIDTISYCNLKCFMCPHKNMKRKPGIMSWDLYKKIIDEIAIENSSTRVWMTFFGEGLMLRDLDERVSYAKRKGLKDVVLNSNGNLLNERWSERLIRAGLDVLYVGIDAFDEDTYKKIRVNGNLNNVVKGVLKYKELLDKIGTKNQKIFVQFVEMSENEKELENFIKFWNKHDIPVKVRPKVSWAGKVEAKNLKDYEFRLPCNWAMNTMNISDQGKVCMCAVDLNCEVIFGDIRLNSIKEIWNTTLKEFRLKHLERRWSELPDLCKNCKDWQSSYASYIDPEVK